MNVMELEIDDFDLILGMDTLAKYRANIDCKRRTVTFSPEGAVRVRGIYVRILSAQNFGAQGEGVAEPELQ